MEKGLDREFTARHITMYKWRNDEYCELEKQNKWKFWIQFNHSELYFT